VGPREDAFFKVEEQNIEFCEFEIVEEMETVIWEISTLKG